MVPNHVSSISRKQLIIKLEELVKAGYSLHSQEVLDVSRELDTIVIALQKGLIREKQQRLISRKRRS
jgi:uncharacterized tellurite resistance protein B-like protein